MEEIQHALMQYHEERKDRASRAIKTSALLTRIQAIRGFKESLFGNVDICYGGDSVIDAVCTDLIGAPLLQFLSPPRRSVTARMSLDAVPGPERSLAYRAITALPLAAFVAIAISGRKNSSTGVHGSQDRTLTIPPSLPDFDFGIVYAILLIESTRRANGMSPAQL